MDNNTESNNDYSKPHISREEIEGIINSRVRDISIYQRAFVHKSIFKSLRFFKDDEVLDYYKDSNERLEYLGDAVLNMIIAKYLYTTFPDKKEGFLTRIRTKLVKGDMLAHFAQKLCLGNYIVMSSHVIKFGGQTNPHILEDAFEALLGAIFLDRGMATAEQFIKDMIKKYVNFKDLFTEDNYKDILSRYTQANSLSLPEYRLIDASGPAHKIEFTIIIYIGEDKYGKGIGKTKKIAEQLAAQKTIKMLKIVDKRNF